MIVNVWDVTTQKNIKNCEMLLKKKLQRKIHTLLDQNIKESKIKIKNSILEVVIAPKLDVKKIIVNVLEKVLDVLGYVDVRIVKISI